MTPENPTPKKRRSAYVSNEKALLNYDAIFTNVSTQPVIQNELAEYGYDAAKIAEGKSLADVARKAYNDNLRENAEVTAARKNFDLQVEQFLAVYVAHRKAAKVCFRRDPAVIKQLGIVGRDPDAFAPRLEEAENFYRIIDLTPAIAASLVQFKITPETIAKAQHQAALVRQARADYLREKGESQDATKQKDAAFRAIETWLSDFFAVARIALEDNPQLLEALTKIVRS